MSAIFGLVHFDNRPVEYADLERMQTALAQHGADGSLWQKDSAGLGQRQMCFTPQDAWERQPLLSGDGAYVLVADARLDNRAELMSGWATGSGERGFEIRGADVPNPSAPVSAPCPPDSELLLRAYQSWGPDCVHHLVGVYAFAIWDTRSQTLFAARSAIVAPSLFYFTTPRIFAFATAPSGLHALPFFPRALDEAGLAHLLTGLGGGPDTTIYRDVLFLPTGHWLLANRDGVTVECFWRPDLTQQIRFGRDEEYLEAFRHLFDRVVSDHLSSTTPVAVQMSGGLDSSAVAAVAARLLAARGQQLTAFTEVPRAGFAFTHFKGAYADETPFVQATAAMHPNLALNLMRTDGQNFLNGLDAMFAYLERPFRNTSNRVWIEAILAAASRHGARVLLDGLQGNLTMSWNGGGWLAELLHKREWGKAMGSLSALAQARGIQPALRAVISQGIVSHLPDGLWLTAHRLRRQKVGAPDSWQSQSAINPIFAAAQRVPELAWDRKHTLRFRPSADTRRARYEALTTQDFGAYISAYRAMFGVDMRSPTADVRLAEFCLALPEEQHWRAGESRALVRRAMAGQLPPAVLANRERGLQAADWFERLLGAQDQVGAELARLERSDLAQRVLDLPKMRRLFEHLPTSSANNLADYLAYQWVLQTGLMVGAFLCWFEDRA